jgi:heme/copper-type cytochrome/quinol oxidase subunit 3|tara:strand:+ start:43 stop:168 length:126 start_codon:yes stop_codon:yes gene_type:complete
MTAEYGLLMFLCGMIAIFIGAIIAYFIINAIQKKERKDDEI